MTIGILAITNENHTVINIHEKVVSRILIPKTEKVFTNLLFDPENFLRKEIAIIELLLNSNNNKLNKSSSLWQLYKKLFLFSQKDSSETLERFVNTALVSAKLHSINYYAWNFIRWISNFCKLCGNKKDLDEHIFKEVLHFCERNLNDAASWSCLSAIMVPDNEGLDIVKFESELIHQGKLQWKKVATENIEEKLLGVCDHIIFDLKPVSPVPYIVIKAFSAYLYKNNSYTIVFNYCQKLKKHIADFDVIINSKGITYEVNKGYFTTSIPTEDDLIFHQDLQRHINLIETVRWIEKFLIDGGKIA